MKFANIFRITYPIKKTHLPFDQLYNYSVTFHQFTLSIIGRSVKTKSLGTFRDNLIGIKI